MCIIASFMYNHIQANIFLVHPFNPTIQPSVTSIVFYIRIIL